MYRLLCLTALFVSSAKGISEHFVDTIIPEDYEGLTSSCKTALNNTLYNCPWFLSKLIFENTPRLDAKPLSILCTDDCKEEMLTVRERIKTACTAEDDVIRWPEEHTYPATYIVDQFLHSYNLTCRRDPKSGEWCDVLVRRWAKQKTLTQAQNCSHCLLGERQIQLESPFSHTDEWAAEFDSWTAHCNRTDYKYKPPGQYVIKYAEDPPPREPPVRHCATKHQVQKFDTCNSIARTYSVSTFDVVLSGIIDPVCSPEVLHQNEEPLCLPEPCDTYMLMQGETCESILNDLNNSITYAQLISWNPNIPRICHDLGILAGDLICISPSGGYI